ncbi:MAG: HAMP domain-containing protein [Desulfobacterales bacterium]|jgi:signal transduction histidine kinase|nr:HAMP domain-containing protein [Desulfobacterales bacterium]
MKNRKLPATGHLIWKLLGINILVIGFVIVIVWLSVDYLAANYFMVLMEKYNIPTGPIHDMFVSAVHRYLIWASLSALLLTVFLSFLLIKRVLEPLAQMTAITRRISSGDYSASIPIRSRDEVGQLAMAFNRMADSLRKIERLRKTMMIDVAHELRTPLSNIQGYLEALIDDVVPRTGETFELLHEETLRLTYLVEDILRLAKADAAKGSLDLMQIRMRDVIEDVLDLFRPQFEAKGVQVDSGNVDRAVRVYADPDKLSQIVRNLMQNAVRYTISGGTFKIFTQPMDRHVRAVFANTGVEVEEQDLPFIFERFYRGEKSRSREHGGAGIGLAIVKGLVEAHNGNVGAEIHGNETHIWFSLPMASSGSRAEFGK